MKPHRCEKLNLASEHLAGDQGERAEVFMGPRLRIVIGMQTLGLAPAEMLVYRLHPGG